MQIGVACSCSLIKARRPTPEKALGSFFGICGVGHPGFVAFAAVAPTITMMVPIRLAILSTQFDGSAAVA
jgi:hypothetical protein